MTPEELPSPQKGPSTLLVEMLQSGPNFRVFGEAVGLELGKDFLAVHQHLEPPVVERLQLQAGNALLEFFENFLRQTDGSRFVLSSGAVFDNDLQGLSPAVNGAARPDKAVPSGLGRRPHIPGPPPPHRPQTTQKEPS